MQAQRHYRASTWSGLLLALAALCCQPAGAQTVQLAKTTQGGTGTYGFTLTNLSSASDSITTTVDGSPTLSPIVHTVTSLAVDITIDETPAVGFQLIGAECVDTSGTVPGPIGGPGGGSAILIPGNTLQLASTVVCTFTNAQAVVDPDLAISKTASPTVVASGGTVTYTLTASNVGSADVTDAVLTDTPGAGLSCTTDGSCSASGGAVCPGSVPVGSLTGGGVTVPSLPVGSAVEVTFACTVTATGLPP